MAGFIFRGEGRKKEILFIQYRSRPFARAILIIIFI